eukprot:Nk52_evm14s166 gene=Nk52_evmTU14s166
MHKTHVDAGTQTVAIAVARRVDERRRSVISILKDYTFDPASVNKSIVKRVRFCLRNSVAEAQAAQGKRYSDMIDTATGEKNKALKTLEAKVNKELVNVITHDAPRRRAVELLVQYALTRWRITNRSQDKRVRKKLSNKLLTAGGGVVLPSLANFDKDAPHEEVETEATDLPPWEDESS